MSALPNPHSFVISTTATNTVEVEVETLLGSRYAFPDVSRESVEQGLPERGRIPENMTYLVFYNYSGAALSVPFQIVKAVRIGEEVLWESPA